jgi:5-methylcytosine-specific restriction protein A
MAKWKWADDKPRSRPMVNDNPKAKIYSYKWHKQRTQYLKANSLCVSCLAKDKPVTATEVDHVKPHLGDLGDIFWNQDNWQALCKSCHSKKTKRERNAGRRVVICGRPGAGKSTLVDTQAAKGDLVFDYDTMISAMVCGLKDKQDNPQDLIDLMEGIRTAFVNYIRTSGTHRSCFVICANERRAKAIAAKLRADLINLG